MKKLCFLTVIALLAVGCKNESEPPAEETPELIAPALYMNVVTSEGDKPFTGVVLRPVREVLLSIMAIMSIAS